MFEETRRIKIVFYFLAILTTLDVIYSIIYKDRSVRVIAAVITVIGIIHVFSKYVHLENRQIVSYKKLIYTFILCYFILITCIIIVCFIKNISIFYALAIQSILFISLLSCYIFNFKLSYFNWNINIKTCSILGFFFLTYFFVGKSNNSSFNSSSLLDLGWVFVYPSLYEEILFRGFLISALKYLRIDEVKINIIQSLFFGISHFSIYLQSDKLCLIGLSQQILLGYMLGMIYFYFHSITPCVIFHGLIDIINL